MNAIHILRSGVHTSNDGASSTFSDDDLARCAAAYDPKLHEAPIVIGHPKQDGPAFGWVEKLEARPEGLFAIPRQVNAEFADLVRQGAYKKISGSFYRPQSKNHPAPGVWYLRHVGFLGAVPPAVKGLRPVDLADGLGDFVDFEENSLDLREHSFNLRERALKSAENKQFINELRKKGTVPFSLVEGLADFIETLSDDGPLNFSDAGAGSITSTQAAWFKTFLGKLPTPVMLGELCNNDFGEGDEGFSAPKSFNVDPESAEIHRKAVEYQRKNGGSYAQAVTAVLKAS